MSILLDALWSQRQIILDHASHLKELRSKVGAPGNMPLCGWTHLYALTRHFAPDLILELGRWFGHSTTVFTETANQLGNCTVVSVDYEIHHNWETKTAPALKASVPPEWYAPLQILDADIRRVDFAPYVAPANRVLMFWNAHGYALAYYILGSVLPLLRNKTHLVIVHDITDIRHSHMHRAYTRFDGKPTY